MALIMMVWALRASVGYQFDLALDPAYLAIYSNLLKFALWVVPAMAFATAVRRDSPIRALRLGLPSARALPLSAALIAAYLGGVAFDTARKHGVTLGELGTALSERGLVNFAGALPSAFSEEVLFRGLVLTELSERWGFWPANAVSGILFVSMHWSHRIWRNGLGLGVVADAPALFAIALALGFVTWRTRSIWPAVIFHAANNTVTGIL
jgi:membrane protease YdiL (CAAX protease family)